MIRKFLKKVWPYALIILVIVRIYDHRLNEAKEQTEKVNKLYQAKIDSGFLTLLKGGYSLMPLAQTIEKISKVSDQEDPAQVQKLIEMAKTQSEDATHYLETIIEFSDNYAMDSVPQVMVNYTVMTSKKQEDMYYLAHQADLYWLMRGISYHYWKDKPKIISKDTRNTLASATKGLKALDSTLLSFKDDASHAIEWGDSREIGQIKDLFLHEIKPHLEQLIKIKSEIKE